METVQLTQFKRKTRVFLHVEGGWCVRPTRSGSREEWRVYFGLLIPGSKAPDNPTERPEAGTFTTKEHAVAWVLKRRGK